jgi:hypothetical protein
MLLGINMLLWTAQVGDDHLQLCESLKRLGYGHDVLRATDAAA